MKNCLAVIEKGNTNLKRLLNPQKAILPFIERKDSNDSPPVSVELHLTSSCICVRTEAEIMPEQIKRVVGIEAKVAILKDEPIRWGDL